MLQALALVLTLSGVPSIPNHAPPSEPTKVREVKDPKPPTPERLLGCDDEYAWRAVTCRWTK